MNRFAVAVTTVWAGAGLLAGTHTESGNHNVFVHAASCDVKSSLTPEQEAFLRRLAALPEETRRGLHFCFAPGTSEEYIAQVSALMYPAGPETYNHASRWPGAQGSPLALSYSFVPDGVTVPANAGLSGGTNSIFATFNGIFGNTSAWQNLFQQSFERWEELSGLSFTMVSDDGAPLFGSAGSDVPPIRGDLRISAIPLDGLGGVLAYNNFPLAEFGTPGGGDMVLDAEDGGNWGLAANNYRFLRNTIMHEHGHGMGLMHVCPANGSKVMEPSINTGFDGPQLDDIRSAQRHYGDTWEVNDTPGQASILPAPKNGKVNGFANLSIDDDSDVDYYALSVPSSADITVTMAPVGTTYDSGPQGFFGCFLAPIDSVQSLTINNLNVYLIDTNGTTVLASGNTQAAGQPEHIAFSVPSAGTYYIRVDSSTTTNDIQMYNLTIGAEFTSNPCPQDVNSDMEVDVFDVLDVLGTWGACADPCPPCATDTNSDCAVDVFDLLDILQVWGPCL